MGGGIQVGWRIPGPPVSPHSPPPPSPVPHPGPSTRTLAHRYRGLPSHSRPWLSVSQASSCDGCVCSALPRSGISFVTITAFFPIPLRLLNRLERRQEIVTESVEGRS